MNFDYSKIGPFLSALLIVFVIYRRFRRSFGQQLLRPIRMQIRIGLLIVVGGLLLPTVFRSAPFVLATLAGTVAGIALAIWGGSRTRFLRTSNQLYYVPHTYTGIAVSLLFLGRLAYRLVQIFTNPHAMRAMDSDPSKQVFIPASMLSSPLTLSLFFVLMGYYVCYYSIVLWKSKRTVPEEISEAPPLPETRIS
ncbi:MAG TPA: hypothetical protein VN815_03615 [Steroidobacteraceae bacterium]|nr:hypothetical protein [Steroidobacteraceae bacterium]